MPKEYMPDEIEAISRDWTDRFVAEQDLGELDLEDPVEDLGVFFDHLPAGSSILDVGCGWGRYVYRFIDHGLLYQGIDYSLEMVKAAREINPGMTFHHGSFRALPFPAVHFDGLWSCCTLSAIPKKQLVAVLREHWRVLKAGGVMMIVMPAPLDNEEEMRTDNKGNPTFYQAHYFRDEFTDYATQAGFVILEGSDRWKHGSFYALVQKPEH